MAKLTEKRIKDAKGSSGALRKSQATQIRYEGSYGGGLAKILPRVDKLLKFKPDLADAYEDIMNDGHLRGLISSRKSGTLSLDWELQADKVDKNITEAIYKVLDGVDIYELMDNILDAILYGMQPIELTWDNVDNLFLPVEIKAKPFHWFGFDDEGNLRFMNEEAGEDGEECHPDKYLLPRNDATFSNPYGVGLLSMCYWNVYFKKHAKDYWAEFCEKFGSPWVVGTFLDKNPTTEEEQAVNDALISIISSNTLTKNNNWELDVKFAQAKQSGDTFEQFINDSKTENAIIFLGHEASTQSTPGKLGNDKNALTAAERLIQEDIRLVTKTLNSLIKKICLYNFPNATDIPYFILFEGDNLNLERAQRDEIIAGMGFAFSPEYIQQAYGYKKGHVFLKRVPKSMREDNEEDTTNAKADHFFNFSSSVILNQKITKENHKLIDELVNHIKSDKKVISSLESMLKPILNHKGDGLKDLEKNYYKLYKDIDGSDYEEFLIKVVNIVDIIGYDAAYREEEVKSTKNNANFRVFNKDPNEISFDDILEALSKSPEEAVEYFKSKGVKISKDAKKRIKAIKEQMFTITGVTKLDMLKDYKDLITAAIEEGITLSEFKKQLKERLSTKGWYSKEEDDLPPWRLNNIYRTNTAEAYNQAKWDRYQETADLIPYVECYSVEDKNTTDKCKWLNGKVFKKTDKTYARKIRAGGHYSCRRTEIPASELDVKGKKIWKGSEVPAQYLNDKEFYKQVGGFKPNLNDYDDDLAKQFEREQK